MQVYGHLAGDIVDNLRIHDNVMAGCELNNLLLGGSDGGTEILGTVTVTGNIITGSQSAEGLRVHDPQGTVIIENNTFYGNAVAQIYLEEAGAGRITLRNNIIVAQAGQQYYEFDVGSSSSSLVSANNLVFGAGACAGWDAGCINQDPLFAGASDYHLQSGSPAIDRGVATSVSRDYDGIPRPQGAAFDIGAYEHHVDAPVCRVSCSATVPASAGVGDPVSFQSTATLLDCADGSISYGWDFGDGSTSAAQNPAHAYAAAGAYHWSLTTTAPGAVSCGSSGTIEIGNSCTPSATTLCLDGAPGDQRFRVHPRFATSQGGGLAGDGQAIQLASLGVIHGGLFWFFDATNPELLVKVLDGCALNDHYWVFYSAGTNVGFTVEILDTHTGRLFSRTNPDLNPAAPVQEVRALPCE